MDHDFLSKGGEMGALMRAKDWDQTLIGPVDKWPQSLRTTLGILLNSKFPMFLFWGEELICFYNDAYRPSLGNDGKHPSILGQKGEEGWPEIWDFIKPLIDQVLIEGEATWHEDQFLPIYRNGKIEDVYWTFSYSPVNDESGQTAGVLVICNETTGKVKMVKELEASTTRYRTNLLQTPSAMCVFRGPEYKVEIVNTLMLELWERKEHEVLNKPIFEALPEAANQGLEEILLNVYTTGERYIASERLVRLLRKGEIVDTYINIVYEALKEHDGIISGIVAVANDVTVQVEARKKVEDAEERARLAGEIAEIATWDLDVPNQALIYSENLATIFGHDKSSKLIRSDLHKQIHPDDFYILQRAYKMALQTSVYKYESRIIKPDNSIAWIRAHGKIFFDENNVPLKMIGTVMDITDEKNRQQILMKSEEKFRLLADSMPQHVWTSDALGNLNYFNQSVYTYAGLSPEAVDKNDWLKIVHPDDREANINAWMEAVNSGNDFLFEHRFRRHDGQYRWQQSHATAQKDEEGNIQMWVGTSTDIQDQKDFTNKLEREVSERTAQLEIKNKDLINMNIELQSFAYISSHDLQEPLRKIQTFASRLADLDEQNISAKAKTYLNRIEVSAKRMQTLIQDLLTYSRTNSAERVFVKTNLDEIAEEVTSDFSERIEETNAIVNFHPLGEITVIPFQFRQLLHNLIGNALKFSKKDEAPYIEITAKRVLGSDLGIRVNYPERIYYCLKIADNGIGFDAEYSERIFEVFQRLNTESEFSGTGIGLAIVKKIVENHKGIITAHSEKGKGATFEIYIPE
ncbi:PAS domain-containing protein [Flavobacterium sp. HTF]|uniref:PAS domain-containing protein n=1 Tax=Flavobacterium sp. HTF TaxID=2170732 RepID=UPI001FAEEBCD|nr:PAS domain-containing protein [Flavobacterium sp. HTF]